MIMRAPPRWTDVIPLGERVLQSVLNHVIAVGDEAETTYLEVKSPLDMGSKAATAKIAKFLLGLANRRPNEAARLFHGYAVLVIGAQKDSAPGVPRGTEAHELEDRLRPYENLESALESECTGSEYVGGHRQSEQRSIGRRAGIANCCGATTPERERGEQGA